MQRPSRPPAARRGPARTCAMLIACCIMSGLMLAAWRCMAASCSGVMRLIMSCGARGRRRRSDALDRLGRPVPSVASRRSTRGSATQPAAPANTHLSHRHHLRVEHGDRGRSPAGGGGRRRSVGGLQQAGERRRVGRRRRQWHTRRSRDRRRAALDLVDNLCAIEAASAPRSAFPGDGQKEGCEGSGFWGLPRSPDAGEHLSEACGNRRKAGRGRGQCSPSVACRSALIWPPQAQSQTRQASIVVC